MSDLLAEPEDAGGDADLGADEGDGEAVEPEVPAVEVLGDPDSAQDPGAAGGEGGEAGEEVGVEEEALDEGGLGGSEGAGEEAEGVKGAAFADGEAGDGEAGGAEGDGQRGLGTERDDGGGPEAAVETGGEGDEGVLGASDIKLGDGQGDPDRVVGPGAGVGEGEAGGEGLQGIRGSEGGEKRISRRDAGTARKREYGRRSPGW